MTTRVVPKYKKIWEQSTGMDQFLQQVGESDESTHTVSEVKEIHGYLHKKEIGRGLQKILECLVRRFDQ